jgi:glycosyltransferase involved in cell wall biosynthesis
MDQELKDSIGRFDALHIHELWHYPHYAAASASQKAGVPYIISPLGGFAPTAIKKGRLKKRLYSALIRGRLTGHAAMYHALTADEASDTADHVDDIPVDVVPLGVDPSQFESLPDAEEFDRLFPELQGKRIVLFMGRLNAIKGLDILIPGFGLAATGRDDLHLVIAGPDAGYESKARELVSSASLESKVSIIGPIYGQTKLAALSRADIFALTSYGEGFSVAILEALAASLPVIITRECHFPAVSKSGAGLEIGLDATEFGRALISLVDRPRMLTEMSAKARSMAMGPYSWDTVGSAFHDIYKQVTHA